MLAWQISAYLFLALCLVNLVGLGYLLYRFRRFSVVLNYNQQVPLTIPLSTHADTSTLDWNLQLSSATGLHVFFYYYVHARPFVALLSHYICYSFGSPATYWFGHIYIYWFILILYYDRLVLLFTSIFDISCVSFPCRSSFLASFSLACQFLAPSWERSAACNLPHRPTWGAFTNRCLLHAVGQHKKGERLHYSQVELAVVVLPSLWTACPLWTLPLSDCNESGVSCHYGQVAGWSLERCSTVTLPSPRSPRSGRGGISLAAGKLPGTCHPAVLPFRSTGSMFCSTLSPVRAGSVFGWLHLPG